MRLWLPLSVVPCVLLAACGGEPVVELDGSVQKGPFVIGSSIAVSALSSDLSPTGQVFNTQTVNDRGEFSVSVPGQSPVALEGRGYYFNEVIGQLSSAELTLRAFFLPTPSSGQKVIVNMVTHLTAERIKTLVEAGSDFTASVAQAELELLVQLGVTDPAYVPQVSSVAMDVIGGDTRDNAYLLTVSSTLIQVVLMGNQSLEGALQELINVYALDLADDGQLAAERRQDVAAAFAVLPVDAIQRNLQQRLTDIGSAGGVPDMRQVLDLAQCCSPGGVGGCCPSAAGELERCDAAQPCPPGLECVSDALRCGPGASCCVSTQPELLSCSPDLPCDAGKTCVSDPAVCGPDRSCCVAQLGCSAANPCGPGLACVTNPADCESGAPCCLEPGVDHIYCSADHPCPAGFDLACVETSAGNDWACYLHGGVGQACNIDGSCDTGLACLPGSIDQCSAATNLSSCCQEVGGQNERCGPGNTCNEGLVCTSGPRPAIDSRCQVPGALNQRCRQEGMEACDPGLSCVNVSAGEFWCLESEVPEVPLGGLGEGCIGDSAVEELTCHGDLACHFGSACTLYGLDECCLPRGEAGASCAGQEQINNCAAGLVCIETGSCESERCCEPAGAEGEPCRASQACDAGLQCDNTGNLACAPWSQCCLPLD